MSPLFSIFHARIRRVKYNWIDGEMLVKRKKRRRNKKKISADPEREKNSFARDESKAEEDRIGIECIYREGERPKAGALGCYPLRRQRERERERNAERFEKERTSERGEEGAKGWERKAGGRHR